jgi:sugar phosphate isomerase/epimerase
MPPKGDRLSAAEGDTGEIGKGLNDYEAIFTERKRVGFDGWISIEDGIDPLRLSPEFLERKSTQYWG